MYESSGLERNLDKAGGIIAAGIFAASFFLIFWQSARQKCWQLAPVLIYAVFRVVGWLLTAIGAIKGDEQINKKGNIVNALAFWLLMFGGLAAVVRWNIARQGINWNRKSTVSTVIILILCVVFGALEGAGQITWYNSPEDDPAITLKIAEVGFLVLSAVLAIGVVYFTIHESMIYQLPKVRIAFIAIAVCFVVRCVFYMLLALHIIKIEADKRSVFMYFLVTVMEMLICLMFGLLGIAKALRMQKTNPAEDMPALDTEDMHVTPTHFDAASDNLKQDIGSNRYSLDRFDTTSTGNYKTNTQHQKTVIARPGVSYHTGAWRQSEDDGGVNPIGISYGAKTKTSAYQYQNQGSSAPMTDSRINAYSTPDTGTPNGSFNPWATVTGPSAQDTVPGQNSWKAMHPPQSSYIMADNAYPQQSPHIEFIPSQDINTDGSRRRHGNISSYVKTPYPQASDNRYLGQLEGSSYARTNIGNPPNATDTPRNDEYFTYHS